MKSCGKFRELEDLFSQYDTKHLPVVDRMIVDINRRMLREKSKSLVTINRNSWQFQGQNTQKTGKFYQSLKHSLSANEYSPKKCYTYLGEFYTRLRHDIEKRRVRSKIRQQIKKILDKKRIELPNSKHKCYIRPHLPHRYENEQVEIEKIYGLPGRPVSSNSFSDKVYMTNYYK